MLLERNGNRRIGAILAPFLMCLAATTAVAGPPDGAMLYGTDQWYLQLPKSNTAKSETFEIFIQEYGAGKPIIVLHGGFGAEHSYMKPLMLPFAISRRVVFYDQRGSLRSPCSDCAFGLANHVADLEALRKAMGQEQIDIVGHSMGTLLAQEYAQRYPGRVGKLVLVGPIAAKAYDGKAYMEGVSTASRTLSSRPVVAELQAKLGIAEGADLSGREAGDMWKIRFSAVNLYDPTHWRRLEGGRALFNRAVSTSSDVQESWNYEPALAALKTPAQIILGDTDYVDMGGTYWKALAAKADSNVRLYFIDRAGHGGWFERADAFAQAMGEALDAR